LLLVARRRQYHSEIRQWRGRRFLTSTYLLQTAPVINRAGDEHVHVGTPGNAAKSGDPEQDRVRIVEPDAGEMACGTIGRDAQ